VFSSFSRGRFCLLMLSHSMERLSWNFPKTPNLNDFAPVATELRAAYVFEEGSVICLVLTHPVGTLISCFVKSMTCDMKWGNVHRQCVGWFPSE
jgi:hypothetical protein